MLEVEKLQNRYTEAYSEYFPIVFSAVYTKVNNRDDAQDIAQEVFLRLYRKFDSVENVRKWLFIALKLVVMEYYRKKKTNEVDIDNIFNDVSLTFVNGFRDARIIIEQALENMELFKGEKGKTIFDLIAINNFTYEQVAKQLGMTRRQVEYRYGQLVPPLINLALDYGCLK